MDNKDGGSLELAEELAGRWEEKDLSRLVPNGVFMGEAPEDTDTPYVVIHPIDEVPSTKTNTNIYWRIRFAIELWTIGWEENADILPKITKEIAYAPITFIDSTVLVLENAPLRYNFIQKEQKWRGFAEFSCLVARTANYSPT